MVSKVLLVLCAVVVFASAIPAAGWGPAGGFNGGAAVNPWIPPWIAAAPWYPQWSPCTTVGPSCLDCTTKSVCTKVGGLQRACTDPTKPYCNAGECSETPTAECAPPESSSSPA